MDKPQVKPVVALVVGYASNVIGHAESDDIEPALRRIFGERARIIFAQDHSFALVTVGHKAIRVGFRHTSQGALL